MTDREKLIEILAKYFTIGDSYEYSLTRVKEAFAIGTMTLDDFVEFDDDKVADIADHLLSHGVTVKKPQKPLTVEELEIFGVYWFEEYEDKLMPCEIGRFSGARYTGMHFIGWSTEEEMENKDYGKIWRCWAEKPTDAERKNAKWEE